jgi:acyl-CoA synthetase (AMP-forming)/AMP-acid ligase II
MMPVAKELSELHGRKLDRPLKTVYDILSHPPNSHGSKVAIVSMHQPAKLYSKVFKGIPTAEYLRWTFDEIARVSHVMALALAEGGVLPGMTIAAFVENNIESQILFRACLELNCPLALLNPKSAINHRELLHMFEILQPSVVVAPNQGIAEVIDEVVVEDMKGVLLKLTCSGETVKHWQSFGAFLEGGLTSNETILDLSIERKPEDVVLIFFTSGTTSLPKGVPHTNDSWGSVLLGNPMGFGISETSISCSHLPFFHCK